MKCEHGKKKYLCKDCGGNGICEHNKRKQYCIICGGKSICEHKKIKIQCILCKGSQICNHNRQKSKCKECHGSQICEHNKLKLQCKQCKGSQICEHNIQKQICKLCGGNQICLHDKQKTRCKDCNGSSLCKTPLCETIGSKKYNFYCFRCFIHLFPDSPNVRNYKTKEYSTVNYIVEHLNKYSWIKDTKIYDGCSKRRPDLFLDLGYQVIIVEIDENQHVSYDSLCENKRVMEISKDINHRPLILFRFNPDGYILKNEKVSSCWGLNKNGISTIKKNKRKEWIERLNTLCTNIDYWCQEENKTNKLIEIIQLYYDIK